MTQNLAPDLPPDFAQRQRALDTRGSFLVRAPAGSGKTHLLTTRFLLLLAEVDDPREIVAITFTRAAAAEMRQRILAELQAAAASPQTQAASHPPDTLREAAHRALHHLRQKQWTLLDYPDQLRIQTIDSFCNSIALRAPLLWENLLALGGSGNIAANPDSLYRQAARQTIAMLDNGPAHLRAALRALLRLRDTRWSDLEDLLCQMLAERSRWFRDFVFDPANISGSDALRGDLEAPMRRAATELFTRVHALLASHPGAEAETLSLLRFAAAHLEDEYPIARSLAAWPTLATHSAETLLDFHRELAWFFLTGEGNWRRSVNKNNGFPATSQAATSKERFKALVEGLRPHAELRFLLQQAADTLICGYTDDEWQIVLHAFVTLRYAYAQLQLVFAEQAALDYSEQAALALRILRDADHSPTDFAIDFASGIRHLLIDEFQDTSRNQYELIDSLVAAWPDLDTRTCFCVGDPMQSIYGFRDSDFELFDRPAQRGFGPERDAFGDPNRILLEPVQLTANFRSAPPLVADLNARMRSIFEAPTPAAQTVFYPAVAARPAATHSSPPAAHPSPQSAPRIQLHLRLADPPTQPDWLPLVRNHLQYAASLRAAASGGRYRIALLARNRTALQLAAQALQSASIAFHADDLIPLSRRSEILDAIALARAALHPQDRLAWASVLRAPWCTLTLAELHTLLSADDRVIQSLSIPDALDSRLPSLALDPDRSAALTHCIKIIRQAGAQRHHASTELAGSWLRRLWQAVGAADATTPQQQRNLELLWSALDQLPRGDLDLVERNPSSGWSAILDKLAPTPDPALDRDFGLHLMTIHKAKGLEFEIVLLLDLARKNGTGTPPMLAWLERGIAPSASPSQPLGLTEFLIAPIQPRGHSRGRALEWVTRQKQLRESAEERRVFYVAATRAREELHLFARATASQLASLASETNAAKPSLLQIIAPAFPTEIEQTLVDADTSAENAPAQPQPATPAAPRLLRLRIPAPQPTPGEPLAIAASAPDLEPLYTRILGGLPSRAEGIAVHLLLQHLARASTGADAPTGSLPTSLTLILTAHLRSLGLPAAQAHPLAQHAVAVAQRTAADPLGQWILAPHPHAFTEAAWTGQLRTPDGHTRWTTLRPDRCFLATAPPALGLTDPLSHANESSWWIIDYKTSGIDYKTSGIDSKTSGSQPASSASSSSPSLQQFLADHRRQFAPQLQLYATLLDELLRTGSHPAAPIRLGLYYPHLNHLDHWQP